MDSEIDFEDFISYETKSIVLSENDKFQDELILDMGNFPTGPETINSPDPYFFQKIGEHLCVEKKEESKKAETTDVLLQVGKNRRKRTRGRKPQKLPLNDDGPIHSRLAFDNTLKRIKIRYINFIVYFVNSAIIFWYKHSKLKIRKLNGKFNKNVNIIMNRQLLNKTLKQVLSEEEISFKYKKAKNINSKTNINLDTIKEIENNNGEFLMRILNTTYEEFYKEVFLKRNNIFGTEYEGIFEEMAKDEKKKKKKKFTSTLDSYDMKTAQQCFIQHFKNY